jgi:hypothetical protein
LEIHCQIGASCNLESDYLLFKDGLTKCRQILAYV